MSLRYKVTLSLLLVGGCTNKCVSFIKEITMARKKSKADTLMDELLAECKAPKEILSKEGLLGQLTKRLVERSLEAEMSEHLGYEKGSVESLMALMATRVMARAKRPSSVIRASLRSKFPSDRNSAASSQCW
jgi:hypothetical protein